MRDKGAAVLDTCTKNGLSTIEVPASFRGTVQEEAVKVDAALLDLEKREAALLSDLKREAERWMPAVQKLSDYWNSLTQRYQALGRSDETERTMHTRQRDRKSVV